MNSEYILNGVKNLKKFVRDFHDIRSSIHR